MPQDKSLFPLNQSSIPSFLLCASRSIPSLALHFMLYFLCHFALQYVNYSTSFCRVLPWKINFFYNMKQNLIASSPRLSMFHIDKCTVPCYIPCDTSLLCPCPWQWRKQIFNLGGAWFFLLPISTHFFTFFSLFLSYFSFDFNGSLGSRGARAPLAPP